MKRFGQLVAAVTATAILMLAPVPAGAGGTPPSEEFCTAFADYYAVQFLIAFAESFSVLDEENGDGEDNNVVAELYLVFSPKLELTTETMLESPPRSLEKGLKRQLKIWRTGVKLLQSDVGLSDEAIETIANLDPDATGGEAEEVLGEEISDKKLRAAAKKYAESIESLRENASRTEAQALEFAATGCGVIPDPTVDCETLVTDDEAAALLGEVSVTETEEGCSWVGPESDTADTNQLTVEVFNSPTAYTRNTELLAGTGEPVPAIGEQATAFDGFSSQTRGSSCGRTLIAVAGEQTLQIALCLGETPVTTDQLVGIFQQVSGRL
jgi:hypothetical protein